MTSPGSSNLKTHMPAAMLDQIATTSQDFSMNVMIPSLNHPCGESSSESRSPDLPPAKASDRESRIIAEKQRRSQYNAQISQMMSLVSDVVRSQRKVDKTSVLRLAANKLRNEHVFGDTIKCSHIETWSNSIMKYFDLFGGFMMAVTCRGRIFNVSPNVQEKLGYCHIDLLGQDIYNYVHPEDKDILSHHIYPIELQTGCDQNNMFLQHHDFNIRIMRAGARSDPPRYERCRIDGRLRRSDRATANAVQVEQVKKRQRVRHNRTFSSSGNDYVFIGMVRLVSNTLPARIISSTTYSEYWTRHLIDGRIVQCDPSISLVSGYMTEEVTGTCAFVFMHRDDVRWVICVLRQMYDQNKEFGETYYRLLNRTGNFIYMRTRGFLEIDRTTKRVQSFVCVNCVVGEDYGRKMLEDMKRKYSVIVSNIEEDHAQNIETGGEPSVEHPKQLERIVMHLVEPSNAENPEVLKLVAPSKENIVTAITNSEKTMKKSVMNFDCRKRKINKTDYDENSEHLKRHMLDVNTEQKTKLDAT